jgi:hypothetical protein
LLAILTSKTNICKKQVLNFKDFLESFIKCKLIIIKERVLHVFNNLDIKDIGFITYDLVLQGFKENQLTVR